MKKRILTGVTTTGSPHLGNYIGAIRPAIAASKTPDTDSFFFLADYHGLVKCKDPEVIHQSGLVAAATWLAAGLNYEEVTFYRQSDIPEILELNWILTTCCAKGLMNRAHAYKAAAQTNTAGQKTDPDDGVEMGLYCYPVLMTADILMFNAHEVPVGKDQLQHLEMARDIAGRFNHRYQKLFTLPRAAVDDRNALLSGLDGRKMSKSYGNTIPLFAEPKKLRQAVMKIVTNSLPPGKPKDPALSPLFTIYHAFAAAGESEKLAAEFAAGIAWGDAKEILFTKLNTVLAPMRERYRELVAKPALIEEILRFGAAKARKISIPFLQDIKKAVGIAPLSDNDGL